MDRVPPLTILAGLALLGGPGCVSAEKAKTQYTSLKQSVGLASPEPVSEVLTFWQRRLATLSDPTRDGAMVSGLVGQVFMISPTSQPAESRGDLAVAVYDTTARPRGQPEAKPELYHFDQATLAKLRTKDERFGACYALFLPWPAEWADVTSVKILARYQAPGGTALQGREVAVQLETERTKMTWEEQNFQKVGGPTPPAPVATAADRRGVPDPLKILASLRGKPAAPPVAPAPLPPAEAFTRSNVPVMTAVERTPLVATPPNTVNTSYATEGAYAGPKPGGPGPLDGVNPAAANGPLQPIVIRRE